MKHIQTVTLTSAATTITFSNIPQNGKDLILYFQTRGLLTSSIVRLIVNGNTNYTGLYTRNRIYGSGSSVFVDNGTTDPIFTSRSNDTANVFAPGYLHIDNYTSAQTKIALIESFQETFASQAFGGLSMQGTYQGAITSLGLGVDPSTDAFAIGTTASLYTIG